MPSTFSTSLRLELVATGEQAGSWGTTTNNNLGTLLEQAVTGVGSIAMTDADLTLTAANGLTDQARSAVLVVTSSTLTATRVLIIPNVPKTYTVFNATTGSQAITVRTSGGTGVTIPNGNIVEVYCNGAGTTTQRSALYNPSTNRVGGGATGAGWSGTTGAFSDAVAFTANPTVLGNALWHAGNFTPASYQLALGYTPVQQGTGIGQTTNTVKLGWSAGSRLKATVDTTDLGNLVFDSQLTTQLAGYLPKTSGSLSNDLTVYRSAAPTPGAVFLGNGGTRYLFWDGTNYSLGGAGTIWHSGNLTSPLTTLGGTITGTLAVNSSLFVGGTAGLQGITGTTCSLNTLTVTGTTGLQAITGTTCALSSVMTCVSPRGSNFGRAMVDNTSAFGPMGWNSGGGYIDIDVIGNPFGINVFVSDERRKDDIAPSTDPVLPLIRQIDFIDFRFKPIGAPEGTVMPYQRGGISAQQVRPIREEWVQELPDGTLMPNVQLLLTNALQGLQELDQEVQALRAEVAALRA